MKLHVRSGCIPEGKTTIDTGNICKGYHPTQSNIAVIIPIKNIGDIRFHISPESLADALELQKWIGEYIEKYA